MVLLVAFDKDSRQHFVQSIKTSFRSRGKQFAPSLLLMTLILAFAKILMEVELAHGIPKNAYFVENMNTCVAAIQDYVTTVTYINGLTLAVGINGITTCTAAGKVITVICTIAGIPLSLIILNQIGRWTCIQVHWLIYYSKKLFRRSKRMYNEVRMVEVFDCCSSDSDFTDNDDDFDVPLSVGIALPVSWMLICAIVYSSLIEWPFGEASYFSFMLLTVGVISDLTVVSPALELFSMFAIFFGLALISNMTNIDNLIKRVENRVEVEMKQAMGEDTKNDDPESIEDKIKRILMELNAPAYMVSMISGDKMTSLAEKCEKAGNVSNLAVQTDAATPEEFPPAPALNNNNDDETQTCPVVLVDNATNPDDVVPCTTTSATQSMDVETGTISTQTSPTRCTLVKNISLVCIDGVLKADLAIQTSNNLRHTSTYCWIKPEVEDEESQAQPNVLHVGSGELELLELVDFGCEVEPLLRNVATQYPSRSFRFPYLRANGPVDDSQK